MQAVKVIGIAAAVIGAGLLSAGLAAVGALAVAIKHASEDMRNWERWNDNDDRRSIRNGAEAYILDIPERQEL